MRRLDELHPRGITLLYLTVIGGLQAIGQIVSNSSTVEVKNVGGKKCTTWMASTLVQKLVRNSKKCTTEEYL